MNDNSKAIASFQGLVGGVPGADMNAAVASLFTQKVRVIKAAADGNATDATTEYVIARMPVAGRLKSAHFTGSSGGIVGHASNNATLTVSKRDGAGGTAVPIASYQSTASNDATQWVPKALTIVAADALLPAGTLLTFKIAKASSGVVVPAGELDLVIDTAGI